MPGSYREGVFQQCESDDAEDVSMHDGQFYQPGSGPVPDAHPAPALRNCHSVGHDEMFGTIIGGDPFGPTKDLTVQLINGQKRTGEGGQAQAPAPPAPATPPSPPPPPQVNETVTVNQTALLNGTAQDPASVNINQNPAPAPYGSDTKNATLGDVSTATNTAQNVSQDTTSTNTTIGAASAAFNNCPLGSRGVQLCGVALLVIVASSMAFAVDIAS